MAWRLSAMMSLMKMLSRNAKIRMAVYVCITNKWYAARDYLFLVTPELHIANDYLAHNSRLWTDLERGGLKSKAVCIRYLFEITIKVNQTHFKSSSLNTYLNITELNTGSHYKFPNVVTSTINGELKNKIDETTAFCICKVGNYKLFTIAALILISIMSILVFLTYFILYAKFQR